MVFGPPAGTMMRDSRRITAIVGYLARAGFWLVILIGVADSVISFMRVENMLPGLVGERMAVDLGLSQWRGPRIHMPLAALAFVIALFTRGPTFIWLALWVVVIQLGIVFGRFIFYYEQAFLADLVRFWYAALFLFASAYTLEEDGHVRVDVFYAAMRPRTKALVNGTGAILFGMSMMWIILILGTNTRASAIIGPFISYEQDQQSFGLMTKYWLAAFLGFFAVMMMLQFAAMLLKSGAEWRNPSDPDLATRQGGAMTAAE
jgi:TRAP-type mannitol/chloroaromatic compound transport system permease small subunit